MAMLENEKLLFVFVELVFFKMESALRVFHDKFSSMHKRVSRKKFFLKN